MSGGPIVLDVRTATPHFPGIGRAAAGLARGLASQGGRDAVSLLHDARPDPRLPLGVLPGIACAASPFNLRQQWQVRRLLRASDARLYHSPYYLMPLAPGTPAVVTCWDLIPLTVSGLFDRGRRLAFRIAHALAFRAASAIIAPSASTARDVASCFPAHARKVHVIRAGWEIESHPESSHEGDSRHVLGAVPPRFVLAVGSNKPHKNLKGLAEAWAKVVAARRGEDVALVLAGPRDARFPDGGPCADALRREGRLVSVGVVSDDTLAELYRRALCLVLPSRAEGFGLPALEAMALGAPVVCSRIPALSELCGDAACFFDPEDVAGLSAVLEHLLDAEDERERLREAGLRRAAAFTWRAAASATMALYDRVVQGEP